MALAEAAVLNAAIVEVQYRKGMVFLDRCGSVMVRLEEVLGEPFQGSVPQMTHGELVNAIERINVRYTPRAFSAVQNWIRSPVRLELIAPQAWDVISETLGVAREVTRFGVRFLHMWRVDNAQEAEQRIEGAGLFAETEAWASTFGRPKVREWTTVSETREGTLRASLSSGEVDIKPAVMMPELRDIVPRHAVVLDLDYSFPGQAPLAIHKGQMKDFIRSSWQRAKTGAASIQERLNAVQLK